MHQPAPASVARPTTGWRSAHQWKLWLSGLIGSRYDGLRHFAVVDPGRLLRCGQPHVRDLDHIRVEHGLAAIVVARGGTRHPLRGRWFRKERAFCEQHGIQLEHIRMSDTSPPAPDVFDRFLNVARNATGHTLVHCEQGFHRTGILCAAYRIGVNGWSLEQAFDEMRTAGFDPDDHRRQPLLDALRNWAQA